MKRTIKTGLSLLLLSAVVMTGFTACGSADQKAEQTANTETKAENTAVTHSDTDGKEETVYVLANADGAQKQVIVSNWLKNKNGDKTLADATTLGDIMSVSGDSTYDGKGTWTTDGGDVYYRGATDKETPVALSISYTLDGKTVTADALAGATGHIEMKIHYENRLSKQVTLNGKEETIYQPFAAMTMLLLDNSAAANVTVSQGTTVNTGDKTVAVCMAMPGLKESLGIDADTEQELQDKANTDFSLSDDVTVSLDATDFSMMNTLTVVQNGLLDKLDLENVSTLDELDGAISKLEDAASQLVDGSKTLADGTQTLANGSDALAAGVDALNDGAETLQNSVSGSLQPGVTKLAAGAKTLAEYAAQLKDGSAKADAGAATLSGGTVELNQGATELNSGVLQVQAGLQALSAKNEELTGGSAEVKAALHEIDEGLSGVSLSTESLSKLVAASGAIQTGIGKLNDGLAALQLQASYAAYKATMAQNGLSLDTVKAGNAQAIAAIPTEIEGLTQLKAALAANPATAAAAAQLDPVIASLSSMQTLLQGNMGAISGTEQYLTAIGSGVAQLAAGASDLNTQYQAFNTAIGTLAGELTTLSGSMTTLASGISELTAQYDALDGGIGEYTAGVAQLFGGYAKLVTGSSKLLDGSASLMNGAASLKDGTAALSTGAAQLSDGANQLSDAGATLVSGAAKLLDGVTTLHDGTATLAAKSGELVNGVKKLNTGAATLRDGMAQFNADGIQKLVSFYNNDITALIDRFKALKTYSAEYTTFSGCADNTPSTVKFIFETDSIG